MKDGVYRESADKDGPPTDELRAGGPEDGTQHEADEEEGEDEIPYFSPDMQFTRNSWNGRGWCR